jgi:hypothetical protein
MGGWDQNGSYEDWLRGVEWIQLTQDKDRWRALLNTVMNIRLLAVRLACEKIKYCTIMLSNTSEVQEPMI